MGAFPKPGSWDGNSSDSQAAFCDERPDDGRFSRVGLSRGGASVVSSNCEAEAGVRVGSGLGCGSSCCGSGSLPAMPNSEARAPQPDGFGLAALGGSFFFFGDGGAGAGAGSADSFAAGASSFTSGLGSSLGSAPRRFERKFQWFFFSSAIWRYRFEARKQGLIGSLDDVWQEFAQGSSVCSELPAARCWLEPKCSPAS